MGLTYRQTKGSALTFQELDANFAYFTGSHSVTGSVIISGSQEIIGSQSITGSFNLTGSVATVASGTERLTGTQTIIGTQTITGSQYLTGSSVINGTLDVFGTVTMVSGSSIVIETQYITGSSIISGSQKISGSQDIFGTTTMTGSLGVSGSITFVGDQVISGSINFGDKGLIQSIPNSSGDGLGASTLELKPDISLGTDQYIVLDPTSPGHIHIRAGGAIDSSSADLYLGGENNYVRTNDNGSITISSINFNLTNPSSGIDSIQVTNGAIYLYDTSNTYVVDVDSKLLIDASGNNSIDWVNRFLQDSAGNTSIDWNSWTAYDDVGGTSINWRNRYLVDSSALNSVDWNNRYLYKSDGTTVAFDWENGQMTGSLSVTGSQVGIKTDSFTVSTGDGLSDLVYVDTTGVYLQDASNTTGLEITISNRKLYDSASVDSINWNTRELLKSDSTVTVDWENGILTGSLHGTASWAENALTASYVENAQTASYVETAQTASYYIAPTGSVIPSSPAPEGSFTFVDDGIGNYYICAYIGGGWKTGSLGS